MTDVKLLVSDMLVSEEKKKVLKQFLSGAAAMLPAVVMIAMASSVKLIMVESGIMRRILDYAQKSFVATVRQAELFIIGVTIVASIPISANAPAAFFSS